MRKMTITTAQNIAIDFRLATVGQRILAFGIDIIILATISGFLSILLTLIHPMLSVASLLIFFFYTLVMELLFSGQTIGKMALKIRVVSVDGKESSPLDSIIRWSFRIIDIWFTIGALAVIGISTSQRAQRLGGLLSNTMVINQNSESSLTLRDILKIEDRSKYNPQYLDVVRFSEDEMLTVKAVLDRYSKYSNHAHRAILENAALRCSEVLELADVPADREVFLRTLIKDYIVITRS